MKIDPTTHPVSWFRDRNIDGSLFLKPPYQRKPVWTTVQKAYLIDSILKGYQIPEIYIHREMDDNEKSIYNIVDGQQRIRTILEFLAGDFSLLEKYTQEYSDDTFSDLPKDKRTEILSFTIYAREITNATEVEIREYFKRMNQNVVSLNAQELRHATYSGDFIRLMEELADDDYWAENKIVTANEIRRMKDIEYISELFVSMINGIQNKTKELDNYYEFYEHEFSNKSAYRKQFQKIVDTIEDIFPDLKNHRWRLKSEYYTLFMVMQEILTKGDISKENVPKLRDALVKFSIQIEQAVKKGGITRKTPQEIVSYAEAASRGTADKDRRIIRHKTLLPLVTKYSTLNKLRDT